MARRSGIPWKEIEGEYRVGQLSVSLIASVYNVSRRSVQRKAALLGWRYGELLPLVNARIEEELALLDRDLALLIESTASILKMFDRLNEKECRTHYTRAGVNAGQQR